MEEQPEAPAAPARRVSWPAVCSYYAIACAISWPFFWWRDESPASWAAWTAPGFVKGLLPAAGPALAALAVFLLFRKTHRRVVTLVGTSAVRSAIFLVAPILVFGILGSGNDQPHLTGLLYGTFLAVYGFGEELGWRGFLQDALRPLAPPLRYLSIGLLWGAWHFTTFLHGSPRQIAIRLTMMIVLWVAGSWGIGQAVEQTRSVLVAAALHLGFNYITLLPTDKWLPLLGISVVVWIVVLRGWKWPADRSDTPAGSAGASAAV